MLSGTGLSRILIEGFSSWREEDHQPHPNTMKHPTSPTDDGKPTIPDQRLITAGGEEDHQPQSKTMEHPTSSMDNGTPNKPDIPTVFLKSRHDDGPTSRKPLPEFNPDDPIGRTFLLPPEDNGERLRGKATGKVVEIIKRQMVKESKTSATFLALIMARWRKSSPIPN